MSETHEALIAGSRPPALPHLEKTFYKEMCLLRTTEEGKRERECVCVCVCVSRAQEPQMTSTKACSGYMSVGNLLNMYPERSINVTVVTTSFADSNCEPLASSMSAALMLQTGCWNLRRRASCCIHCTELPTASQRTNLRLRSYLDDRAMAIVDDS